MTQQSQIRQAIKQLETAIATLRKMLPSKDKPQENPGDDLAGKLCLECKKPIEINGRRGLCGGCYHAAMRLLKYTPTTEDELIAANRIAPRSKPGRKSTRDYSHLPPVAKTQELQAETTKPPESSAEAKPRRGKK